MSALRTWRGAIVGGRYDPWLDLAARWPQIEARLEPLTGRLLGEVRLPRTGPPVIMLRRGSSAAQLRCTLAHEIVHLERGIAECGAFADRFADREERAVHLHAARRLIALPNLCAALGELGGDADVGALATLLDADRFTTDLRLRTLSSAERDAVRAGLSSEIAQIA